MQKRGQVTIFVIIGILIIVSILLFLFLRSRVYLGPGTILDLEQEFPQIEEHIQECLLEAVEPRIIQMGLQGGFIRTPDGTFRQYQGNKVSYLCYNIRDQPFCRSRILTIPNMEAEISEFVKRDIESQCLNIAGFGKIGYDIIEGPLEITTDIGDDKIIITANIPITIIKGANKAERSEFSTSINLPLGRLYNAAHDIVNTEAISGFSDTLLYSVAKTQTTNKPYIIQKLQPYPDKLYIAKIKDVPSEDDPFIFQFFIEGEPR